MSKAPFERSRVILGWVLSGCLFYGVYGLFVDVVMPLARYMLIFLQGVAKESLEVAMVVILVAVAIAIIRSGPKKGV